MGTVTADGTLFGGAAGVTTTGGGTATLMTAGTIGETVAITAGFTTVTATAVNLNTLPNSVPSLAATATTGNVAFYAAAGLTQSSASDYIKPPNGTVTVDMGTAANTSTTTISGTTQIVSKAGSEPAIVSVAGTNTVTLNLSSSTTAAPMVSTNSLGLSGSFHDFNLTGFALPTGR